MKRFIEALSNLTRPCTDFSAWDFYARVRWLVGYLAITFSTY